MPPKQTRRVKRPPSTSPAPQDSRLLDRAVTLERARASLWEYQKLRDPKFFKENRPHLKVISDALQEVYEGKRLRADGEPYRKMVLSVPPRHGKSYSVAGFNQWAYGQNHDARIAVISYNDILTGRFSQGVRDTIDEKRITDDQIVYNDIFPEVSLKYGDSARGIWALEGEHFSFLATSFNGTMTGVGFNIGIIDDPIKHPSEALNDEFLEAQFRWYTDAYLSRLEEDAMQIIVMTRWASGDLAGRVQAAEPGEWLEIRLEAYDQRTDRMLCPELLSRKTYEARKKLTTPDIFNANYHQQPIDAKDKLYDHFQTFKWDELPHDEQNHVKFEVIASYTDTADEGTDMLCSIIFGVIAGQAYVLDILYTDRPMEYTEQEAAKRHHQQRVEVAKIESNNGGRGFARAVKRILWEKHKTRRVKVDWFFQSANKRARIITNAPYVMENVLYPEGWEERWPEYARAMHSYKRKGKNEHDDAPDGTTGVAEMLQEGIQKKLTFGYRTLGGG